MFRWFGSAKVVLSLSAMAVLGCSDDGGSDVPPPIGTGGSNVGGAAGTSNAGNAGGGMANAGSGGTGMAEAVSFAADIYPILSANCAGAGCHGNGSFLPTHANSDINIAYEQATEFAEEIAGRVSGALTPIMPQMCGPRPGVGTCLSLEEVALIEEWFEQGAPP